MNTREELVQTFQDYQATQFGGWSWGKNDPTNGKDEGRFASYKNGERVEYPPKVEADQVLLK